MNVASLLAAAKAHNRIDDSDDDDSILLMLATAAGDVAHAGNYALPEHATDLPDDLKLAIIDQAAMLFDVRGADTERPEGLSLAAARVVARYRGVSL